MGAQQPAEVVFDIMPKLLRASLGKVHTIVRPQPARLSLEIWPVLHITTLIVDEAVPDVDVGDPSFVGPGAIKLVEITHIACRFGAADRRKSHPHDRHAPRFERRDHVVYALR